MMKRFLIALFFLLPNLSSADDALQAAVEDLIVAVEKSDCTFIRNGQEHPSEEAADHLRKKYLHFRDQIRTPEDFIRLAGTRSELSGRPYLIRCGRGTPLPSAEWLSRELARNRHHGTPGTNGQYE